MYEESMKKYKTEKGIRVSLVFNGNRTRQVAGDQFPGCRERWGACIGSLTFGSSSPLKLNNNLSRLVSPLIALTHDGPVVQKRFGHLWQSPSIKAWSITEPTLPPTKLRLLVALTDGSCQQCAISYRRYEYNDNLSEGLLVIDNPNTMMTWVKGCQLSTIWVQWQPKWKIANYQQYDWHE